MSGVANLAARLEKLVGNNRVTASESAVREFAIAGRVPVAVLKPCAAEEVAEIVGFVAAENLAMVACGSRSKLELGMPPRRYDLALDMTGLRQIAHYDPGDLTVSADAGMPLNELAKALAAKKQFLPLAVPCGATSTVGGAVASGIDSALRQQYGTARDFLIGAEFVDGTGRRCKSGGRVVKNVTGYDLHKLLIGSLGTLGVITRLNFRTFPQPELGSAHTATFPTMEGAQNFHALLFKSGLPFSNLELFDPEFSALLVGFLNKAGGSIPDSLAKTGWHVFASFKGSAAVIERLQRELRERSPEKQAASCETLDAQGSQQLSDALGEAFDWLRSAGSNVALARIVLPQPALGDLGVLLKMSQQPALRLAFVVRACNVAYFALLARSEDTQTKATMERSVSELFFRAEAKNGSATLLHAPLWLKDRMNVWGTKRPDFSLLQRVKQAFDPQNIFSPGRFVGDI
jgi:glycolate dehydrogenase FAD-binding subunit